LRMMTSSSGEYVEPKGAGVGSGMCGYVRKRSLSLRGTLTTPA
jgi:hypothetical protein